MGSVFYVNDAAMDTHKLLAEPRLVCFGLEINTIDQSRTPGAKFGRPTISYGSRLVQCYLYHEKSYFTDEYLHSETLLVGMGNISLATNCSGTEWKS